MQQTYLINTFKTKFNGISKYYVCKVIKKALKDLRSNPLIVPSILLPYSVIELDLFELTTAEILKLNLMYRSKKKAASCLSFEQKTIVNNILYLGSIIICPNELYNEKLSFQHSFKKHTAFMIIHSLLHLLGYEHGEEMESLELMLINKTVIN